MNAYDKIYLEKAQIALGRMLDVAVYDLQYDLTDFFEMFIASGIAQRFESGESTYLVGKSGAELAFEVVRIVENREVRIHPNYTANRSPEYWTGWALAYYQWKVDLPFREIIKYVPIKEILGMYSPYHEMDIREFVSGMNKRYRKAKPDTSLKVIRNQNGLSQSELARLAGMPVRTIQHYEQRQKNINKAAASTLAALAKALNCSIEDLFEAESTFEDEKNM